MKENERDVELVEQVQSNVVDLSFIFLILKAKFLFFFSVVDARCFYVFILRSAVAKFEIWVCTFKLKR